MSLPATTEVKPAPPVIEKIKVKVDGREIEVPKLSPDHAGKLVPTTMIQACGAARTDVPHYCYHPKLPIAGNCRMCLVEFGTPALGPDRCERALDLRDGIARAARALDARCSGVPVNDVYHVTQDPYSSYEAVVDAASGDLGTAGSGPQLQRTDSGLTPLQSAVGIGVGPARSLRWQNDTASQITNERVQVASNGCGANCAQDDVYRIRFYETTYSVPRFNNAGSQVTVLIVQNPTADVVNGKVYFWSTAGALIAAPPFTIAAKSLFVLNTSTVAPGVGGTMTIAHDARYGDLSGKTVALEPATGFSFDTPMVPRPQ